MSEIFITGHRNPDMDSICSAYGYAKLKNIADRQNTYIPVRCGHLSDSLKNQVAAAGIEVPPYRRDINPRVSDIVRTDGPAIQCTAPIYDLMKIMRKHRKSRPSVIQLFSGKKFCGLVSIDDIAQWFLNDNMGEFPLYRLTLDNMIKVLHCTVVKRGTPDDFEAPILSGPTHNAEHPDAVAVIHYDRSSAQHAIDCNVPVVVLTDVREEVELDTSSFKGSILISALESTETVRRLRMTSPVSVLLGNQGRNLQMSDLFDDARDRLSSSNLRGLAVFDGEEYKGFVTRRCFLEKPKHKIIMVDHNEPEQSIRGIENADLVEIIDHHRLDAPKTDLPIFIDAEPLGSTCTIVYRLFRRHNLSPDPETAKVLLAGVLSDTLTMRSPTTTDTDRSSAEELARIAGIDNIEQFGQSMFEKVESLDSRKAEDVIVSDMKTYREGGYEIGVAQCEVPTLKDYESYCERYLKTLESVRSSRHLDWALLMITDVLKCTSILLSTANSLEANLSYEKIKDHVFNMHDTVSRKMQLLPEIIYAVNMSKN